MSPLRKVFDVVLWLLAGAAIALAVTFLRGQGVERASWWVTIVGTFASVGVAVAALAVSFAAWRRPVATPPAPPVAPPATTRGPGPSATPPAGPPPTTQRGDVTVTGDGNVTGDNNQVWR